MSTDDASASFEEEQPASPRRAPAKLEDSRDDRPWTDRDTNLLRTRYGIVDEGFLARDLGRSIPAIREKAWEVFGTPPRTGPWSAEDTETLRRFLGAFERKLLARRLGRTLDEIEQRAAELRKDATSAPLTVDETALFKRVYGTRSDEDLEVVFGRTRDLIMGMAAELCLKKDKAFLRRSSGGEKKTRMPRWTPAELDKLRELYPTSSNLAIAQALDRSVKSVVSKAHVLGLKKDPGRLREMGQQNVRLRHERKGD